MRKIFVRGFIYGGSIPFEVIWESGKDRGNFLLAKDSEGRYTFGQDPEDFYNNVCSSVTDTLNRIKEYLDILTMAPFCDMRYYQNKKSVYDQMSQMLSAEV